MSLKDRLNSQLKTTIDNETVNAKFQESIKKSENMSSEPIGLGIIDAFLVDENLNSIYVSGAKSVFVEKKGVTHKSTSIFRDNIQLINLIKKNAIDCGIEYDESAPYIKYNYKKGVNIVATLPPLSSTPFMFIKSYHDENANLKALQEFQAISKELAMVIEAFSGLKVNILVAGKPQSLKTTLLSSIAKLLPAKNRGVAVDFKNEMQIDKDNFVSYDISAFKNTDLEFELINSIFDSNPDRIIINDCDDKFFNVALSKLSMGYKGLAVSVNANDCDSAINNVAQIMLKYNSGMNFETAKRSLYRMFDIIILADKDENGLRKVSKISEPDIEENKINDIFYLSENNEHLSSGIVPKFYLLSNSLSINSNIFYENYKHTYSKVSVEDFKPSGDLIKKIKENASNDTFENISRSLASEEILKKAQAKFEEIKRNAVIQRFEEDASENSEKTNENGEFENQSYEQVDNQESNQLEGQPSDRFNEQNSEQNNGSNGENYNNVDDNNNENNYENNNNIE